MSQPAVPSARPRPPRPVRPGSRDPAEKDRQSGLRASVLETALEIGFSSNSTVANWIFNNPLEEGEEGEEEEEEEDVTVSVPISLSPSILYCDTTGRSFLFSIEIPLLIPIVSRHQP
jgi:hypothetical protein